MLFLVSKVTSKMRMYKMMSFCLLIFQNLSKKRKRNYGIRPRKPTELWEIGSTIGDAVSSFWKNFILLKNLPFSLLKLTFLPWAYPSNVVYALFVRIDGLEKTVRCRSMSPAVRVKHMQMMTVLFSLHGVSFGVSNVKLNPIRLWSICVFVSLEEIRSCNHIWKFPCE